MIKMLCENGMPKDIAIMVVTGVHADMKKNNPSVLPDFKKLIEKRIK